jgi:hypothetical protein
MSVPLGIVTGFTLVGLIRALLDPSFKGDYVMLSVAWLFAVAWDTYERQRQWRDINRIVDEIRSLIR